MLAGVRTASHDAVGLQEKGRWTTLPFAVARSIPLLPSGNRRRLCRLEARMGAVGPHRYTTVSCVRVVTTPARDGHSGGARGGSPAVASGGGMENTGAASTLRGGGDGGAPRRGGSGSLAPAQIAGVPAAIDLSLDGERAQVSPVERGVERLVMGLQRED